MKKEISGELIGTFILVFFGCSSVAASVLFGAFNLFEVALIWGLGVSIAIFSTRNICPAHLNPAVSLAMTFSGYLPIKKLPMYVLAQFLGALLAGSFVYLIFGDSIAFYESQNGIIRGTDESIRTGMIFGEYFPNPGFREHVRMTVPLAVFMESVGTFILVFVIFRLTEHKKQIDNLTPLLIGFTVTLLICLIAPFTQAGINPARDFGPRVFAYFSGWNSAAFPSPDFSFLTVYIAGPLAGGILASLTQKALIK